MNERELFAAVLRSLVQKATGVENVLFGYQTAVAPGGPYATVVVTSIQETAPGHIEREYLKDERRIRTTLVTPVIYTVTVNFWRCPDAVATAGRLVYCARLPSIHYLLFSAGCGWCDSDPVQNLTAEQSSAYEQRAAITFRIVGTQRVTDEANTIEQLNGITVEDTEGRILSETRS